MFIGHYAVALAAKRYAPEKSLGWSFIAVQFLDVLWAPFILLGIERARVVPGFLPASSLDLYYMPWTHSLLMAFAWSWVFYRVTKSRVLGVCVFSHWVLDLVAHAPDLSLMKGPPYLGLGLWRSRPGTFWTEAVMLVIGTAIYFGCTKLKNALGRYGMPVFVLLLIVINAWNLYGPPPSNIKAVAASGEVALWVLAAIAAWLDRARVPALVKGKTSGSYGGPVTANSTEL
ncbi:MAG: hypothetical protein JO061_22505 [Acidobacteriaceae bacterium]|nr:hypothetical protein [Acidobacteriaceae bacterium]